MNVTLFLVCVMIFGLPNDIPTQDLRLLAWLSIIAATVYMTWMALYYSRVMALRTELETEAERYSAAVKELEGAQRIAEKVRHDRSLFFSKMSHELRTPLNAIIGYSEIPSRIVPTGPTSTRRPQRTSHASMRPASTFSPSSPRPSTQTRSSAACRRSTSRSSGSVIFAMMWSQPSSR